MQRHDEGALVSVSMDVLGMGATGLTLASSMESPWALKLVNWLVFWLVRGLAGLVGLM